MTTSEVAGQYQARRGVFDEVVDEDGAPRAAWRAVERELGPLDPAVLLDRQRQTDRLLDAEGTGHLVHELSLATDRHGHSVAARSQSHPWRLDPIPYVVDATEFESLAAAARQRMRALEALLVDCYGPRRLITDGVLPAALLHSLPGFRPSLGDARPDRWLVHYAIDLVRGADGGWRVVQDLTDAPSGFGYALLNRSVLARVVPTAVRAVGAAAIGNHADVLRQALAALAPADRSSPRSVLLSAGPADPTYVEHSYLATRLGIHLVEGADVVMRAGRLWLRVLDGLEPIDVVYRRIADAQLDPLEPAHVGGGAGVPGLVWGARSGGVVLGNAYGAGVAEARALATVLQEAAPLLVDESLALPDYEPSEAMATSPVFSAPIAGPSADPLRGGLEARSVVLRLHLTRVGDEIVVAPGGNGRVLAHGDHPARPTEQIAKDVWVIGLHAPGRVSTSVSRPQVDFGSSVPKRVADALYWLGRAAERAEVMARAARVVGLQVDQDPMLVGVADGAWAAGVHGLLRSARGAPVEPFPTDVPASVALSAELSAISAAAASQLAVLVQEAASVREYLSVTTGRVLGRLARTHALLVDGDGTRDDLDTVLVDLAALSGLAMESTVRGPAWRFLDLGRRIERALAVLGEVEATIGADTPHLALQPVADAVLAANESLVSYRRRYRSDVDLDAVLDLLLRDDANPRSLAYQLDRLREHVAGLAWTEGVAIVQAASLESIASVESLAVNGRRVSLDAYVLAVRAELLRLADAIVQRWFADPVNPTVLRGQ